MTTDRDLSQLLLIKCENISNVLLTHSTTTKQQRLDIANELRQATELAKQLVLRSETKAVKPRMG